MGDMVCRHISSSYTYVDQTKVVLIDGKLLGSNLFLQCRGIGALEIHT